LLFGLASVGLARVAVRNRDELLRWFSAGAVLAGLASLHYALSPTLYSEWVYTGDFLRVGFYVLLLVGAAREIQHHWESRAHAAVLEERRRLARDLHDGVAQELAYIWRQARRLAATTDGPTVAGLTGSAERALHESRRAIAALTVTPSQSLAAAMTQAVEAVAGRVGIHAVIDVADGIDVSPEDREQMLRIACEAVANAGRHGQASVVRVEVVRGDSPRLRISDDGVGFDPASSARPGAFGLASMADRALAMGARLSVTSAPGMGTRVELVLP
jgi:signal transduction histidine kinase